MSSVRLLFLPRSPPPRLPPSLSLPSSHRLTLSHPPLSPRHSPLLPRMAGGERTPDAYPKERQGTLQGRRSVPHGLASSFDSQSPQFIRPNQGVPSSRRRNGSSDLQRSRSVQKTVPYDICMRGGSYPIKWNHALLEGNRENKRKLELSINSTEIQYLRSGMVLLKNFIKHTDQVKIVEVCRKLGMGTGGFYAPDGKLHFMMMCLGRDWNPKSRLYEDRRSFDGSKPPKIPEYFKRLVEDAIQASHDFLRQNGEATSVEKELPNMSPDICLVNFYENNGKLGLHKDQDESKSSLVEGLPVVSFSVGDTANFRYGDRRDKSTERVELESGDVLIFGGKSRLVFHGVSRIKAKTAPERLIEETKLRPGRLNLTFRQY